jgi:hypothetical protein
VSGERFVPPAIFAYRQRRRFGKKAREWNGSAGRWVPASSKSSTGIDLKRCVETTFDASI